MSEALSWGLHVHMREARTLNSSLERQGAEASGNIHRSWNPTSEQQFEQATLPSEGLETSSLFCRQVSKGFSELGLQVALLQDDCEMSVNGSGQTSTHCSAIGRRPY